MGWTSDSHTAVNVPSYAHGPNAERFDGYFDDAGVSAGIDEALGLDFERGQEIDYGHEE